MKKTAAGIVSLWEGAQDQVEITAEDMMKNLTETFAQKQEFETLFAELMDAGLTGLANELVAQGPGAIDAIRTLASDSAQAWQAEFMLDPTGAMNRLANNPANDAIARAFGANLGALAGQAFADSFGLVHIPAPAMPNLPRGIPAQGPGSLGDLLRASGGPVSGGTPYVVGEQGPELFVPNQSGDIVPNDKMGGRTVNVYIERVETDDLPGDVAEGLIRASITEQVDLIGAW